jgi:SlyX protein
MADEIDQKIEVLETRIAFQDDLLGKLDEALGDQQQQILKLTHRLGVVMEQLKESQASLPEPPDEPPPHY